MRITRVLFFAVILTMVSSAGAQEEKEPYKATQAETDRGIELADQLIKMRSTLAKTHVKPKAAINEEVAKKVCIAVSEKAKKLAEGHKVDDKEIYIIRFVAERYRNPANAANENEKRVLRLFDEEREIKEDWGGVTIDGKQYYRYMKPIFAEKPCLACHGEEKKAPAFIKKKYPKDRSYGFKEGDLMGAVAVFTWKGF